MYDTAMNTNQPLYIFLRGINVGGVRIVMNDLAATLAAAGYGAVQTVLATGNVVCRPAHVTDTAGYKADIERLLSDRFGYRASVHIRRQADLIRLCAAADLLHRDATQHCYALIADSEATIAALGRDYGAIPADPQQQFSAHGADALWVVTKGQTLTAPFGTIVLGSATYKAKVTSRTIATIQRLTTIGIL